MDGTKGLEPSGGGSLMRYWVFACLAAVPANALDVDLTEFGIAPMIHAPLVEAVLVRRKPEPEPDEDSIAPVTCKAGMAVDTDGPTGGERVPDPETHQDETSASYSGGGYINAFRVPYVVKPLGSRPGRNHCDVPLTAVKLWDVVVVEYQGKRARAIVADEGPAGKFGEGSVRLHDLLGNERARENVGIAGGVTYTFYPNSGKRAENEKALLSFLEDWIPPVIAPPRPRPPAQPPRPPRRRRRDR